MEALRIIGGRPLHGQVQASGAKNAALPIMAAALMARGAVQLARVPRVSDVETLSRLLQALGMQVESSGTGQLHLATIDSTAHRAPASLVRRMRASLCVLGPLLAARGRAVVPLPGGCRIGPRPIDLHLRGLSALGAELRITQGHVVARARRLRGATVHLAGPRGPTVTGTANLLCAAALARGRTVIRGAAQEPEIVDLGKFLQQLGARIDGLGSAEIEITGVEQLGSCQHTLIADRIEVGTLLVAAAITGGQVSIADADCQHLAAVLESLAGAGASLTTNKSTIALARMQPLRAIRVFAAPYPAFPTDLQAQFMALATLAAGESTVADRIFPQRTAHVAQLRRLGADLSIDARSPAMRATVRGVRQLDGAALRATDLRASAALVVAALAARGASIVHGLHHLDRGYDNLSGKLQALGGQVERVPIEAQRANPHAVLGSLC